MCFPRRDGSPQKPWNSSKFVEPGDGTSISVVDHILESQRQNGGNGSFVFVCHTNLQSFTQALNKIPKPRIRSGRKPVSAPGNCEQIVEFLQQILGSPASLS